MKKSFVLYLDQHEPIKNLSLEQKGELLEAMFAFNLHEELKIKDPIVKIVFGFFEQTFKRDCLKWEGVANRNKENGKKGGRPKGSKNKGLSETQDNPGNPLGLLETQDNLKEPRKPVSGSISVSDSDIVNDIKEKKKFQKNLAEEVINLLNKITGKKFQQTDSNIGFITARLNENNKLTLEDFEKVINHKKKDDYFINNNGKFLRPQTLFGTKFDSYLNECVELKGHEKVKIKLISGAIENAKFMTETAQKRKEEIEANENR